MVPPVEMQRPQIVFLCMEQGECPLSVGGGKVPWERWYTTNVKFLGTSVPFHPSPGHEALPPTSLSFFFVNWPKIHPSPCYLGRGLGCEEMRDELQEPSLALVIPL